MRCNAVDITRIIAYELYDKFMDIDKLKYLKQVERGYSICLKDINHIVWIITCIFFICAVWLCLDEYNRPQSDSKQRTMFLFVLWFTYWDLKSPAPALCVENVTCIFVEWSKFERYTVNKWKPSLNCCFGHSADEC